MPADPDTRRLLASDAFAQCWRGAPQLMADPTRLQELLANVEMKAIESDFLQTRARAVHIDISAAVVEAFLEDGADASKLSTERAERLRLVVAGLSYLVLDDRPDSGAPSDGRSEGPADDLAVVRWVSLVAAGSEPFSPEDFAELEG